MNTKTFLSLGSLSSYLMGSAALAAPMDAELYHLLSNHPQLQAVSHSVDSSKEGVTEAFAGYLPTVAVTGSTGYEHIDRTENDPGSTMSNRGADSVSLNITQKLFDGLRREAGYDTAKTVEEIAVITLDQTQQQIMLEAVSAYLDVLRQVKLTELAGQNERTLKTQLNLEDERVQRGSGIAVDVLQAKSRLQISKERKTAFIGALKDAVSRYTQVYGKAPDIANMVLPGIPYEMIPPTLDDALAVAVNDNPALMNSQRNVEVAELARTTADAGYYPTFDVVGTAKYDNDVSGTAGEEINYTMKLEASWEIFSGFATNAQSDRAAYDYQASLDTHSYTKRKIVEEVKLAWSSYNTTRQRMELLDNAVNIAAEVFEARKKLRDAGSETALNVLDAENELYRARIDAQSARYDHYTSAYRVLASIGHLNLATIAPEYAAVEIEPSVPDSTAPEEDDTIEYIPTPEDAMPPEAATEEEEAGEEVVEKEEGASLPAEEPAPTGENAV